MELKIGDKVTLVINDRFLGIIIGFVVRQNGRIYDVSFVDSNGEPKIATFYDFEMKPIEEDNRIGFNNVNKGEKNVET